MMPLALTLRSGRGAAARRFGSSSAFAGLAKPLSALGVDGNLSFCGPLAAKPLLPSACASSGCGEKIYGFVRVEKFSTVDSLPDSEGIDETVGSVKLVGGAGDSKATFSEASRNNKESFTDELEKASREGDGETAQKMMIDLFESEMAKANESSHGEVGHSSNLARRSFNFAMKAWENSDDPSAPEKAELLLGMMWEEHERGNLPFAKPNTFDYYVVMNCWTKKDKRSKKKGIPYSASKNIEKLLQDLRQRAAAGDTSMRPRFGHYLRCLVSYAASGDVGKCYDILHMQSDDHKSLITVHPPSTLGMNSLINAWRVSQSEESPSGAQEILGLMSTECEAGNIDMTPDHISHHLVICCWAESNHQDKATRAFDNLLEMRNRFSQGKICYGPNLQVYIMVMNALAARGDIERVDYLLRQALGDFDVSFLNDIRNVHLFSSLIKACSNSRNRDAPEQAEAILSEMWERCEAGERFCRPTRQDYTMLISCWSKSNRSDCGERAELLLRDILGRKGLRVDIQHYNTLCFAWANSCANGSFDKVRSLIEEMGDAGMVADQYTYNAWLKAALCEKSPNSAERVEQVLSTMKERRIESDHSTRNLLNQVGKKSNLEKH